MPVVTKTPQEQDPESAQNSTASASLPSKAPEEISQSEGPELLPSSRNLRVTITDRETGQALASQRAELSVVPLNIDERGSTAAYRLLVRDPGSSNISESLLIVDSRSVTLMDPNGERTELGQLPRLPRGGADRLGERLKLFFENEEGGQWLVGSTLIGAVTKLSDIDPDKCNFSVAVTKVPEVYSGTARADTYSIERYQQEERHKVVSELFDELTYDDKKALLDATKAWVAGAGNCPILGTNTLEQLGISRDKAKSILEPSKDLGQTLTLLQNNLSRFINGLSRALAYTPGPAPCRSQDVGVHFVVRDGKEFDVIIGTLPAGIPLRPPFKVGATISEDSGVKLISEKPRASVSLSSNGMYSRRFHALDPSGDLQNVTISDLSVTSPDLHRTVFHFSFDQETQKLFLVEPSRNGDRTVSRLITGLSPEEKAALQGGPSPEVANALDKILNSLLAKTSIVQKNLPASQSDPRDFTVGVATISFTTLYRKAPL